MFPFNSGFASRAKPAHQITCAVRSAKASHPHGSTNYPANCHGIEIARHTGPSHDRALTVHRLPPAPKQGESRINSRRLPCAKSRDGFRQPK